MPKTIDQQIEAINYAINLVDHLDSPVLLSECMIALGDARDNLERMKKTGHPTGKT